MGDFYLETSCQLLEQVNLALNLFRVLPGEVERL